MACRRDFRSPHSNLFPSYFLPWHPLGERSIARHFGLSTLISYHDLSRCVLYIFRRLCGLVRWNCQPGLCFLNVSVLSPAKLGVLWL